MTTRALGKRLFREFASLGASTALLQATRFGTVVFAARVMPQPDMGWWNALQALVGYSMLVQGGVLNGMNRDIPVRVGRGDSSGAERAEQVGLSVAALTAGVLLAGGLGIGAVAFALGHRSAGLIVAGGVLAGTQVLWLHGQMRAASRIAFGNLARQQLVVAILTAVCAVVLVSAFGVIGLAVAFAVANLGGFLTSRRGAPRFKLLVDWEEVRRLARTGAPIVLAGVGFTILTSVDRWVILHRGDAMTLGLYTPAILVFTALSLGPSVVGQQFYPRIARRFGETGRVGSLVPLGIRQAAAAFALSLLSGAVSYAILPVAVSILMPRYTQGVESARWIVVGLTVFTLSGGAANILISANRQLAYFAIMLVGIGLAAALETGAWTLGFGMRGVALAASVTYGLVGAIIVGYVWLIVGDEARQTASHPGS